MRRLDRSDLHELAVPHGELALLLELGLGEALADGFVIAADERVDADALAALEGWPCAFVRPEGAPAPAALVALRTDLGAELARAEAGSIAAALFGVSSSRFDSLIPPAASEEALGVTLARFAPERPLAAPGLARLGDVLGRLRAREPRATFLVQALRVPLRPLALQSRDPRTGLGPARVATDEGARALAESLVWRPIDAAALDHARRSQLTKLAASAERLARRPVRLLLDQGDPDRLVAAIPLRRAGLVAFELAADLVRRGSVTRPEALELVDPTDLDQAVQLELDIEPRALVTTGVAAGSGIASGRVALSPAKALAMAGEGSPVVLFVHELEPEDAAAVRCASAVVTVRGGITGEAAVMARALGKPCVASGSALSLGAGGVNVSGGGVLEEGALITVDGARGHIVRDVVARRLPAVAASVAEVISWLDRDALYARVSCPAEVRTALALGAAGPALDASDRATIQRALSGTGATRALLRTGDLGAEETAALCAQATELTGVKLIPCAFPDPDARGWSERDGHVVCARPEAVLRVALELARRGPAGSGPTEWGRGFASSRGGAP